MFICSPVSEPLVPEAMSSDHVPSASLRWKYMSTSPGTDGVASARSRRRPLRAGPRTPRSRS